MTTSILLADERSLELLKPTVYERKYLTTEQNRHNPLERSLIFLHESAAGNNLISPNWVISIKTVQIAPEDLC